MLQAWSHIFGDFSTRLSWPVRNLYCGNKINHRIVACGVPSRQVTLRRFDSHWDDLIVKVVKMKVLSCANLCQEVGIFSPHPDYRNCHPWSELKLYGFVPSRVTSCMISWMFDRLTMATTRYDKQRRMRLRNLDSLDSESSKMPSFQLNAVWSFLFAFTDGNKDAYACPQISWFN